MKRVHAKRQAIELKNIDLNLLVVLDEVVRARSTTMAARRLGRTQSAVSHALSRLRDVFGDPLFVRSGRALIPTPLCEALRAPLIDLLDRTRALVEVGAAFDASRLARTFTVASTDFFDSVLWPRALGPILDDAPLVNVTTRAIADNLEVALANRDADIGFTTRAITQASVVTAEVGSDELALVLRKGHKALARFARGGRADVDVAAYAALDHVLVVPRGLPGSPVDTLLEARGLRRRVVLRTPSFAAAARLIAESDIVTAMPARFAAALAAREPIAIVPLPFVPPRFTFTAAWSRAVDEDPAHQWFRRHLLAAAHDVFAAPRPAARKRRVKRSG